MLQREEVNGSEKSSHEATEDRFNRFEWVVIRSFTILLLILFLSEKMVKEIGDIGKVWGNTTTVQASTQNAEAGTCACTLVSASACIRRTRSART